MRLAYQQRGMSSLGWLVSATVTVFFITCAVKLIPAYISSMTVASTIESLIGREQAATMQPAEIRNALAKYFNTNQVSVITVKDVKIERDKTSGGYLIDASYEERIPLMFNIDVVLKFDNLRYSTKTGKLE